MKNHGLVSVTSLFCLYFLPSITSRIIPSSSSSSLDDHLHSVNNNRNDEINPPPKVGDGFKDDVNKVALFERIVFYASL